VRFSFRNTTSSILTVTATFMEQRALNGWCFILTPITPLTLTRPPNDNTNPNPNSNHTLYTPHSNSTAGNVPAGAGAAGGGRPVPDTRCGWCGRVRIGQPLSAALSLPLPPSIYSLSLSRLPLSNTVSRPPPPPPFLQFFSLLSFSGSLAHTSVAFRYNCVAEREH
jgi:hypothetical protein